MIDWWGPIIHEYYAAREKRLHGHQYRGVAEPSGSVGRAKLGVIHFCIRGTAPKCRSGRRARCSSRTAISSSIYNDPEKTRSSRNAQGWTTLGDIGRLDHEGYLYLTDRKSFVISPAA